MTWRKFITMQEKKKPKNRVSPNADNRFVCLQSRRSKFRYPTLKKALLACKYSDDKQRPYYCKACCCYHTTSESKEEFYNNLESAFEKRFGFKPIRSKRYKKF